MAGKKRSGLANDKRAYGCGRPCNQVNPPPPPPPTTYRVTYNGNTNTSGTAPVDGSSPYITGSRVTVLGNTGSPILAKTGYTFAGWNTAADGSGTSYVGGNIFTINANTTLYAQWTPVGPTTYTVTYNKNGTSVTGNVPVDGSSPYDPSSIVTVLGNTGSPVLSRSGYIFAGWNTAANGSGTSYAGGDTFTIASNTILYAQWTPVYTVTYNGNTNTSGTVPVDGSSPYTTGSTVTVLGNTGSLIKTGFTFTGWNTAANGSGTSYSPSSTFTINANTTLYAQWTPGSSYTVTYNGNTNTSGTAPVDGSSPYTGGSTVTVLGNSGSPVLAKTGYQFAGWNTAADGSGTSYVGGNTFTINADTTLYAQWIPQLSGVTLLYAAGTGGSGTAPSSSGTTYPTYSTQPVVGNAGFTNGALVFGGWNTAANGSGTSYPVGSNVTMIPNTSFNPITLYAQWIDPSTTYTLTYNPGTGGLSLIHI